MRNQRTKRGCARSLFFILFYSLFLSSLFFSWITYAQEFPKLSKLRNEGAKVSALVYDLNTQKVITQLSPGQRLSPASISKLVIGADALKTWGPGKTFSSQIYLRGKLKNDVLFGDLIFYGAGDPSLTNEKIWFLTTDVSRYGIHKITGKLIVNNSLFGFIRKDENRLAGQNHSQNAYDGPLSSASVNYSVLAIVVSPGQQEGQAAQISLEPYELPSEHIINQVVTSDHHPAQIHVERRSQNGIDTYLVSGHLPRDSKTIRIYRSVSNPNQYAGETINAFLNHAGVKTSDHIEIENSPLKPSDKLVAQVDGFPLSWQLRGLFEMSNNFIADMLTLNLDLPNRAFRENSDLENSAKKLTHFMQTLVSESQQERQQDDVTHPLVLKSGSGLTPENRMSAQDMVTLLKKIYTDSSLFPDFLAALAMPGEAGTLKKRFLTKTLAKQSFLGETDIMIRAKTGTLSEPWNVVALAGYAKLKNGHWSAFTIIVNTPKKNYFNIDNIRWALDSDLMQILTKSF